MENNNDKFNDSYITQALNHGPCMGCERCYDYLNIPDERLERYFATHPDPWRSIQPQ